MRLRVRGRSAKEHARLELPPEWEEQFQRTPKERRSEKLRLWLVPWARRWLTRPGPERKVGPALDASLGPGQTRDVGPNEREYLLWMMLGLETRHAPWKE